MHNTRVIHRDVKSANIFLSKDGLVKLADFGVARVLSTQTDFASTCIGTPFTISPEVSKGWVEGLANKWGGLRACQQMQYLCCMTCWYP